jgi:hypothetical protein
VRGCGRTKASPTAAAATKASPTAASRKTRLLLVGWVIVPAHGVAAGHPNLIISSGLQSNKASPRTLLEQAIAASAAVGLAIGAAVPDAVRSGRS